MKDQIKLLVGVINNEMMIPNTFAHQIMGHGAGFWPVNNRHNYRIIPSQKPFHRSLGLPSSNLQKCT